VTDNSRYRKEYKIIPISKNFKTSFGISNRKKPSIIYIRLNSWAKYLYDIKEYGICLKILNSTIRNKIKSEIRDSMAFDPMFFYTPNIKKVLYKNQSKFHTCFEITIKQSEPIISNIEILTNKVENMINNIIGEIENDNNFVFSLKNN
jgi:hypothetical protein